MTNMVDRLLTLLETIDRLYRSLLEALDRERAALAEVSLPAFMLAGENKTALLERLKDLEDQRAQQIRQLAAALGLPQQGITVSDLAGCLPPAAAARLKVGSRNLRITLNRVHEQNEANRSLLDDSLDFVQNALGMLQNLRRPPSTYRHNGQMAWAPGGGSLVADDI